MARSAHHLTSLRISCLALVVLSCGRLGAADHVVVDLWPDLKVDPTAGEERVTERSKTDKPDRSFSNVTKPTLTAVLPDKPTGAAVIICPGGG